MSTLRPEDFDPDWAAEQRCRAAGWLPPDEAAQLIKDRAAAVSEVKVMRATEDANHVAFRAAVQPVIDAARAMVAKRDAKYRAKYEAEPNRGDPEWWTDGLAEDIALARAVDALDADSPPEGPTE